MRIKDIFSPLFFIVLGIAFLAVSAWFFISKNPKAVRYKYKLGGMILSLSFFASSCGSSSNPPTVITCYVAVPSENSIYSVIKKEDIQLNDSLFFYIDLPTYPHYSYLLTDSISKKEFQKDFLEYSTEKAYYFLPLKLIPEDYQGKFSVKIFGEANEELQQKDLLHAETFILSKDVEKD